MPIIEFLPLRVHTDSQGITANIQVMTTAPYI